MSKRILVVEGQEDDRRIIRDVLAGTDYEITEAEDGEHALAAVAKRAARSHPHGNPAAEHGWL
jgi:CheY-like chemotaxis protein